MKFLYKIYSRYDGFTPSEIPQRAVDDGKRLVLGWAKYLDVVSKNDECWIYFHGPHSFQNGVYVKGSVNQIDHTKRRVILSIRQFSTSEPLTDPVTSERVAESVSTNGRQVFVWPETAEIAQQCSLAACANRLCGACAQWESFELISPGDLNAPGGIPVPTERFVPAYWALPARCFIYQEGYDPKLSIQRLTHMFYDFKVGERRYAYPLALGMYSAIRDRTDGEFDAIVPIPLSPEKLAAGELHRTLQLSRELGRLLECPVREALSLSAPISKRAMKSEGYTTYQFEQRYWDLLGVSAPVAAGSRILLVDDVCTHGSTLSQAGRKLLHDNDDIDLWMSTAAQMTVKRAVGNVSSCVV